MEKIKNALGFLTSKKVYMSAAAMVVLVLAVREPKLVAIGVTAIAVTYVAVQGWIDTKK